MGDRFVRFVTICMFSVLITIGLGGCEKETKAPDVEPMPESFSFFDVTVNTAYDASLRDALKKKLGKEAVSTKIPIDLEMNYQGFIKTHFPQIDALNHELNGKFGVRVEHNVIQLAYRYINNPDAPFDRVELFFSGWTRRPLMFRIFSRQDGGQVLAALRQKYSDAKTIKWGEEAEKTFYWEKHGDILIFSERLNPAGRKEYEIVINYTKTIRDLLERENRKPEPGQDNETTPLKNVF